MIQTIHIGRLLRETVASPYRNLVTRPTGAAIRGRIQEALAQSDCALALLDFSGIELLDLSCADEVVAKLLLAHAECGRCVVLQGLREDQHEAIEHVLTHHHLAIAVVAPGTDDEGPWLLGWVTADALASALEWSRTRVEEALDALALHRLVRTEGDLYLPLSLA
jgi:hypothetical protein